MMLMASTGGEVRETGEFLLDGITKLGSMMPCRCWLLLVVLTGCWAPTSTPNEQHNEATRAHEHPQQAPPTSTPNEHPQRSPPTSTPNKHPQRAPPTSTPNEPMHFEWNLISFLVGSLLYDTKIGRSVAIERLLVMDLSHMGVL